MTNASTETISLLEEVAEFLEGQADVRDGSDGPRPNRAMSLMSEVELTIERLKRDSRLGPSHNWISVQDRQPEKVGHYLGWDAGHGASTAFFNEGRWQDCFGWEDAPITHWMPLPPMPSTATPSKSATDAFNGDTV
jgi:hypothetical protein